MKRTTGFLAFMTVAGTHRRRVWRPRRQLVERDHGRKCDDGRVERDDGRGRTDDRRRAARGH